MSLADSSILLTIVFLLTFSLPTALLKILIDEYTQLIDGNFKTVKHKSLQDIETFHDGNDDGYRKEYDGIDNHRACMEENILILVSVA